MLKRIFSCAGIGVILLQAEVMTPNVSTKQLKYESLSWAARNAKRDEQPAQPVENKGSMALSVFDPLAMPATLASGSEAGSLLFLALSRQPQGAGKIENVEMVVPNLGTPEPPTRRAALAFEVEQPLLSRSVAMILTTPELVATAALGNRNDRY